MFRLLAILVALYFSSKADGFPHVFSLEGSKKIPTLGIHDRPHVAYQALNHEPTGFDEDLASQEKKDQALNQVKKAQYFLSLPNSDPYTHDSTALLLASAVNLYNKAYDRPPLNSSLISDNVNALKEILKEIEPQEQSPSNPIKIPGMPQIVLDEMYARRVARAAVREAVNAVKDARKDQRDPLSDESTAELIEDAILKYNKAYGRRKFRLARKQDKAYHDNQKLDEINAIFDHMNKQEEEN